MILLLGVFWDIRGCLVANRCLFVFGFLRCIFQTFEGMQKQQVPRRLV